VSSLSFRYLCADRTVTVSISKNIVKSNPPIPSHFQLRVPEAESAKPTDPHIRQSTLAKSFPVKLASFASASKIAAHEEERPNNANINRQLFIPPKIRSATKYPMVSTLAFVFVFLTRWVSIAIAPDSKKPPKRAALTLSNRISLLGRGVLLVGLFAFRLHLHCQSRCSRRLCSWVLCSWQDAYSQTEICSSGFRCMSGTVTVSAG
jgi:hypothetical protein